MRAVRKQLTASGIPVENSKGEWGPGQEEINVKYADALTMADRHVVLKNAIKEIAHFQGKAVTFMAKWDFGLAGSSSHIHMSLAGSGKNAFFDPKAEHGMSAADEALRGRASSPMRSEITYFLAPYINSYKRFQAGTFAPTKAIWSFDNRTAGFRLCGADTKGVRIECRIGGADLNPYLAYAALLAAGTQRHRGQAGARGAVLRRRLFRQEAARGATRRCATPPSRCANPRCCATAFGDGVDRPLRPHRRMGAVRI